MRFSIPIITALAASIVAASPRRYEVLMIQVDDAPAAVDYMDFASDIPLIDLWQEKDFLGLKFTGSSTAGTCKNLQGTGFRNRVRSGKSRPGFRCTIWVEPDCKGTGFSFNAQPGIASLPSWIDKKSQSWKCVTA